MRYPSGYSLLEVMIVVSLVVILAALAIPAQQKLVNDSAAQAANEQLFRAINLARNEAMTRGGVVTLCKSVDHKTCSGDWLDGQLVFTDPARTGVIKDPHQLIRVFQPLAKRGKLFWRSFPDHDYLQFAASGATRGQNGTFWYCHAKTVLPVWAIIITKAGRARIAYPDERGLIKDSQGQNILC